MKERKSLSSITRDKISTSKKGQVPWNKGLHWEQSINDKNSESHLGQIPWNKGKIGLQRHTQVTRDKMTISHLGKIPWNKGLTKETDSRVANISKSIKELWQDSEFAKKCLQRRIPSYPEQIFMNLCQEYSLPFKYVGNGELIINRKNPDFVGIENDYKLIEIWGEHFHIGQNPKDRIDFFKVRGYECLVIYANELRHGLEIASQVLKFAYGG